MMIMMIAIMIVIMIMMMFRKSVEFCSESDIWKLNVAHVLFMQVIWRQASSSKHKEFGLE